MAQGKGPAYARWAKVYNLKQMAAALQYLREHELANYAALEASTEAAVNRFHKLAGELRDTEAALSKTVRLMEATVDYAKTRPVFDGYKAARYSKKYLAQHEAELAAYRAAKVAMNENKVTTNEMIAQMVAEARRLGYSESSIAVIDTESDMGKRDRAIILTAATTGLRACDIIRLKLSDIDWRKSEIRLCQKKTGRTVYVPLVKEAEAALQDYILNAPPASDCPDVFLRAVAPKTAIANAVCIGSMFQQYQKKDGITRHAFDGKGFHGLRRRLAKKRISSSLTV